ncbi:hypothetical protein [Caldicellulosiruptor kronotskyensis]|uniref:hypothetical protein n=1 Tax=Caldicellulosiruptor kronotskyensis TaxID=413889 RepID=UPI0011D09414|nr:hypothetical protein [Caldicellulosiruptor kronotskyensis]
MIYIYNDRIISNFKDYVNVNLKMYMYDGTANLKYYSLTNALKSIKFPRNLIGLGVGTYGSKAVNFLAKDYM